MYSEEGYLPNRVVGPIELAKFPNGARRGVVATSPITTADAILVSAPLAMVTAPQGTELGAERLLAALNDQKMSAADSHRLSLLCGDGSQAGPSPQVVPFEQLVDAERHVKRLTEKAAAASKGFGSAKAKGAKGGGAAGDQPEHLTDALQQRLPGVVRTNAFGRVHRDLAASVTRKEQPASFIGLWPEFAMVNHCCAPNSVPTLVGDRLVLRAARDIGKGNEVTVTYLDELTLTPLEQRRQYLQSAYGFKCTCHRCALEERQPEAVTARLQAIHATISEPAFQARARSALNTKNAPSVARVAEEVKGMTDGLEADMEASQVAAGDRPWLRASAYAAYELAVLCTDVGDEGSPDAPRSLSGLHSLVLPGHDGHLLLALERFVRAGSQSRTGPETESAARECITAHTIRYGAVSDAVMAQIMDARAQRDSYMGRYSVLKL
ncbi:hypothetical protein FOA52_012187 [Chlamydomonas sp. UWO 241]|nr:hypothetical protein FOA52_012187 [Chlamydomonas sp. UWO 241]